MNYYLDIQSRNHYVGIENNNIINPTSFYSGDTMSLNYNLLEPSASTYGTINKINTYLSCSLGYPYYTSSTIVSSTILNYDNNNYTGTLMIYPGEFFTNNIEYDGYYEIKLFSGSTISTIYSAPVSIKKDLI